MHTPYTINSWYCGHVKQDREHKTTITMVTHHPNFALTNNTPYGLDGPAMRCLPLVLQRKYLRYIRSQNINNSYAIAFFRGSRYFLLGDKFQSFALLHIRNRINIDNTMACIKSPSSVNARILRHTFEGRTIRYPFNYHGLTLISAWISNHTHSKMWVELLIHS